MVQISPLFIAMAVACTLYLSEMGSAMAESSKPVLLDESASQLKQDFNAARGKIRLVLVVDPICPTCLRGMADVDAALLAKTHDRRLQTFVVHVPVIGAQAADVPPSYTLLHNANVRHYWNPSGNFGRQLSAALHLTRGDKAAYAWDVWMLYPADTLWNASVPAPAVFMHQLPGLPKNQFLDADQFGIRARALLAKLPADVK